jgi:hypothetical protein
MCGFAPEQTHAREQRKLKHMIKRKLKIVRRTNNIPVMGECSVCQMQFPAHYPLSGQSAAQAAIQQQFNAHKCENASSDQAAAPAAGEATNHK